MSTDLESLRLSVRYDEGDGPIMVLLHGINSDATDWRKVIDTIGNGYRFIALDLLGFGDSPKPLDIDYTADEHSLVIRNTLRDIGVDRPFLMVGYSLGGDIAIRYAATWPAEVRRLFLLSAPFYLPPSVFERQGFGTMYLQVIVFQWAWKFIAMSKKKNSLIYEIADGKARDFAQQFLRTDDVPTSWDVMGKNLDNCISKATFVDDLPKLDMPVTFALGIRDPIVHPDQTPILKRLKPDLDVRRIVGLSADHFMLLNLPDTVAEEIMRDEVTGLHVRYRAGQGAPTVFLHGIREDPAFWTRIATALSARREVAMVDLLGFGESPRPLSFRYGLSDHVDAVLATIEREFADTPVRLVGHGFGATVALGVAAADPRHVVDVTAFSPLLVAHAADGTPVAEQATEEVLAIRDQAREMVGDARAQTAVEHAEEVLVPTLRTVDNAVLNTHATDLAARIDVPVRTVLPTGDPSEGREHMRAVFSEKPQFTVVEPAGTHWMPLDDPAATVLLLEPGDDGAAQAAAAARAPVAADSGLSVVRHAFASTSNQVLWRGLIELALGLALFAISNVPLRLITFGFAGWVLVEGISTISGAVGLRRSGLSGWLPWLLIGALSFATGAFLLLRSEISLKIVGVVIAVRAIYVGAANLYVVRKVAETPKARWLLVLEGLLGVVLGACLLFAPHIGAPVLKMLLEIYLIGAGLSSIAYAVANRWAVRKRVRAALARSQTAKGAP